MSNFELIQGNCLEKMKGIRDGSVDLVLTDLPYGTTACKWDVIIPLEPMWKQLKRVIKSNGAIVITANQPFTTILIASNMKMFRYCWVWLKTVPTGHLNANRMPMKWHEDVVVFYKKLPTYNPILRRGVGYSVKLSNVHSENYGKQRNVGTSKNDGTQYKPKDVIGPFRNINRRGKLHPTQKPIELMSYLIKTYTNQGDVVLDNCMGSGTTGVACRNLNRNFIGIELDSKYFKIAKKRINENL